MKYFLFCVLLFCQNLFSFTFKDKLLQGEPGAYVIIERSGLAFFIHFHSKKGKTLIYEEITLPLYQVKKIKDWSQWAKQGAVGHTSWILYQLDIETGKLLESYSPSLKKWIEIKESQAMLPSLLSLELEYLSDKERIQKGPTQRPGEMSSQPWGPVQIKNGEKILNPSYDVYQAKWTHPQTELYGKEVIVYFDRQDPTFPFPYWVQLCSKTIRFKMHAIDSGTGFLSAVAEFPNKLPFFNGIPYKENGELCLNVIASSSYENLTLFAIDLTKSSTSSHPITFNQERTGQSLILRISLDEVRRSLIEGHEYLWLITSNQPKVRVEAPFIYKH